VRNILSLAGDRKLLDRYDQYVTHQQLEKMDEFIWCANPQCNAGQLNAGGKSNNIVTCFACHQKTCFTHRAQWHEGRTCQEYDLEIDPDYELSQRWIVACLADFQPIRQDGNHRHKNTCKHYAPYDSE
jgi:hypothetical protein